MATARQRERSARNKAIGFGRAQFTGEVDPPNENEARVLVQGWIDKHDNSGFRIAGWRQWTKNPHVWIVIDSGGNPHYGAAYDDICGTAFSHGGTEGIINRHFERAHADRRGATDDWRVDWLEMEHDGAEIPHRILRANIDLRVSAVALFVISAAIPFAVVENPIFRALTNTHLHAETISGRVRSIGAKVETEMVSIGKTMKVGVLCFDEWQSGTLEEFLSGECCGLTEDYEYFQICLEHLPLANGTADALASAMLQTLGRYGILEKIKFVVSDNASAAIAACRKMGKPRSTCHAHTVNLVFQGAIQPAVDQLSALNDMAGRIRHSSRFAQICREMASAGEIATNRTKVRGWAPSRWLSFTKFAEDVVDLELPILAFQKHQVGRRAALRRSSQSVGALMGQFEAPSGKRFNWAETQGFSHRPTLMQGALPSEEAMRSAIDVVKQVLPFLRIFAQDCAVLERDGFGSICDVLPTIHDLGNAARNIPLIAESWANGMLEHWDPHVNDEGRKILRIAFLLHPAHPHEAVLGDDFTKARSELEAYIAEIEEVPAETETRRSRSPGNIAAATGRWADMKAAAVDRGELDRYLDMCRTITSIDVPDLRLWWIKHRKLFPKLFRASMEICIIPATSAACERQFSKAKRQLTKRRRRMTAATLRATVMCAENLGLAQKVAGLDSVALDAVRRDIKGGPDETPTRQPRCSPRRRWDSPQSSQRRQVLVDT